MRGLSSRISSFVDAHAGIIAGGYTVVALVWIWASDWLVELASAGNAELARWMQSVKGSAFILGTGFGLYLILAFANARRRRLAEEKRLVEDMLGVAQRLEALGTLAASIAHDFNNVMHIIRGVAELSKMENFNAQKVPERIGEIERAARHACQIVKQMMLFMRNAPVERITGDLGAVLREILPLLQQAAGDRVTINVQVTAPLPLVSFDRSQLERTLINLVVNARDALQGVKLPRITIEIGRRTLRDYRSLFQHDPRSGPFVALAVTDNGTGIPREHLANIFAPFFTTKPEGKGTGLGLTSALHVMQTHQGWIEADSEVGKGTCFTLFFPIAAEQAPAAA